MFLPLHDNTRLRLIRFQYVTSGLIIVNLGLFLLTRYLISPTQMQDAIMSFGLIPAIATGAAELEANLEIIPSAGSFLTYMFLHKGWLHLLSNVLFLWVFADNVEDLFGHFGFLLFYLACGAFAALAYLISDAGSHTPLIGASGAISGMLASYMLLFPRARIWILLIFYIPLRISALTAVIAWFLFQVISLWFSPEGSIVVAWWAHIGGFAAGIIITVAMRPVLVRRFEGK